KQKNIDTGMGLERLAVAVQDVDSIFDVDTVRSLRDAVCALSGSEYGAKHETDVSIRIITDHVRSATFMISDGILPSNEGRGYVLRRLIRRAARHGRLLGIEGAFLSRLSENVIEGSKDGYPELDEKRDFILNVVTQEENKFEKTIDSGLSVLKDMTAELSKNGEKVLSGSEAFKLYDTFGFPLDLTREILEEKGFSVDEGGYRAAMQEQSDRARKARKKSNYMGADATVYEEIDAALQSAFVGYEHTEYDGKVIALCSLAAEGEGNDEVVDALTDGMSGAIITDFTPFYGTMGGQVGDKGTIIGPDGEFQVEITEHVAGSKIAHIGKVIRGMFRRGESVSLKVDMENRASVCRNHSATHLLQSALKDVLGSHVEQSGSYQDAGKTRFDFSHFEAMSTSQIEEVEKEVNREIAKSIPVVTEVLSLEDAKKTGATALFGEKYGDTVRVVEMGDFSKEFCGGTHVKNTGDIQSFKIISESGVAAGVRRIEAITGQNVVSYYKEIENELEKAAALLKASKYDVSDKIQKLQDEIKELRSENESLKSKSAADSLGNIEDKIKEVKGLKFIASEVQNADRAALRDLSDKLREKIQEGVVVLISKADGRVSIVVSATEGAIKRGAHAGNLIKIIAPLVGGGGGGRPNMAEAGGKNPAGVPAALEKVGQALEDMI
ncbi:MAG: alanine--tRNA ligase, partial [Lachnospiraceae bacterium]|nr:alanine--tRNA ligase [Lachnospiraceae bacterium]